MKKRMQKEEEKRGEERNFITDLKAHTQLEVAWSRHSDLQCACGILWC
jgi:hypothetical protein